MTYLSTLPPLPEKEVTTKQSSNYIEVHFGEPMILIELHTRWKVPYWNRDNSKSATCRKAHPNTGHSWKVQPWSSLYYWWTSTTLRQSPCSSSAGQSLQGVVYWICSLVARSCILVPPCDSCKLQFSQTSESCLFPESHKLHSRIECCNAEEIAKQLNHSQMTLCDLKYRLMKRCRSEWIYS